MTGVNLSLEGAGDAARGVGTLLGNIRSLVTGELAPEDKLKAVLAELEAGKAIDLSQLAVNAEEAKSANVFVAGWRPAIGWVCAFGFAWDTVVYTLVSWILAVVAPEAKMPLIDTALLLSTMGGMLGLGTLRTIEKIKGAEGNR